MKMFEYMAAARLIVSSDLPVLREILNQQNAVLCDPTDIAAWTAAIHQAMMDAEWCFSLAAAARQDAEQYTWRSRVKRCLGLELSEILSA
jgi:glycosyltransferase involved in cell wall biosynthesis